ncbi:hypothetical protein BVRB_2g034460 [Beta vulgaris subsp. vulgaris]|nr:hypothetical protein BVRB_2g034460 [Beta vulgaris subsp. vulgaris]
MSPSFCYLGRANYPSGRCAVTNDTLHLPTRWVLVDFYTSLGLCFCKTKLIY